MASITQNDSDEMITAINVTPLVDVVLVLLVIFMITAPAIYQATIKVELPKAMSGEKTEHITLRFTMLANGELRLGSDPIAKEKVGDIIKQALEKDPTANAVIAADQSLTHGTVMTFIDALKTNGISKVAIGVQSPNADQPSKGVK